MYGIYANIWGILMVNVTIYGIHTDPMGKCLQSDVDSHDQDQMGKPYPWVSHILIKLEKPMPHLTNPPQSRPALFFVGKVRLPFVKTGQTVTWLVQFGSIWRKVLGLTLEPVQPVQRRFMLDADDFARAFHVFF